MTQVLDPLEASRRIDRAYRGYLLSTFRPQRADLAREFELAIENAELTRGPYLEASPPFESGASVRDLIDEGVLSPLFSRFSEADFPIERPLYVHQEQAIRKAVAGRNLIISTGTGSGKTEAFLVPILNGLFTEIESGSIAEPGVRALLLYPMNALANDQVKRLRRLLSSFPEITFGRYVGETKARRGEAEDDFRHRYPREPRVLNELLAREQMQEAPPSILLTNYAMLEYLLLRPADSSFVDGPTARFWRHLVLDEAHTYDGAQGTEVAMLLRRLRDRIHQSERGRLQCFATSATLGRGVDDYPQLLSFAKQLFDEDFEWVEGDPARQDIVEAVRRPLVTGAGSYALSQSVLAGLQEAFRGGRSAEELAHRIASHAEIEPPGPDEGPAAFLGRALAGEATVVELQRQLTAGTKSLDELAAELFDGPTARSDLVKLVDLLVAARRHDDDSPLLPARYHFWVGSLEGGYLCLHPEHPSGQPRLHLGRHEHCPVCHRAGRRSHMVELGVCRSCGAEYAVGRLGRTGLGEQLQLTTDHDRAPEYFLLGDWADAVDDDAEVLGEEGHAQGVQRWIDVELGLIIEADSPGEAMDGGPRVPVTFIERADRSQPLHRCAVCSSSVVGEIVFRLLTGVDAPVSVIATELYQAIPPSTDPEQADEVGQGRKLLSFADSRQDAAYFAPYLNRTYQRAVARALIHTAIQSLHHPGEPPRFDDLTEDVRRRAERALLLDPDAGRTANLNEVANWVTQEALALDRRQSLDGLGLADISIALPRRFRAPDALSALDLSDEEARDLTLMLLDTLRLSGAVSVPDGVDIRHERFAPRNVEVTVRGDQSEKGVVAWVPGGSSLNRRADIIDKVAAARGVTVDARDMLRTLWREITEPDGPWSAILVASSSAKLGTTYRLNHERLAFEPASEAKAPLECPVCRRIWWRAVAGACSSWRCRGVPKPIDDLERLGSNHYARLYRELEPIGMSVEEHTAQWRAAEASRIQDEFVRGRKNVLSCSTTFEMGVDVGEVQAILMRNVPPRASNYVQRAGRAGRRQDSAALVVTMAQRRSHDRAHFADPRPMINGSIQPPLINLDNAPILRRHAHSVAFAAFQRDCVDRGEEPYRRVEEFFTAGDHDAGVDRMRAFLEARPEGVRAALERLLPPVIAKDLGVDDWAWVRALYDHDPEEPTFGWLGRATAEVRDDLEKLSEMIDEAFAEQKGGLGDRLKRVRRFLAARELLGFLASRNVLPKYGFPVDVVQLDLGRTGSRLAQNLELDRDLRLAISDYAPGACVVAGGALWRAEGIRRGYRDEDLPLYHWRVCRDCGAFRSSIEEIDPACTECGSDLAETAGKFLIPRYGFVGEYAGEPGDSRPPRNRRVRTWFASYRDAVPDLVPVTELSSVLRVSARTSSQGRIVTINEGPAARGYRFCDWCGRGEPAPLRRAAKGKRSVKDRSHKDLRRPGKNCSGMMRSAQLGHDYLTDVLEIRIEGTAREKYRDPAMRSVLYALLAAAPRLGIARDDVDGTLYSFGTDAPQALVLFDAVPGGAGHSQFLSKHLVDLFEAGYDVVDACDCEETSSCYGCLRSYSNQLFHDELSRADARALLGHLLGRSAAGDLELFSPLTHRLLSEALAAGAPAPVAGFETKEGVVLEAAWPDQRVAILLDEDERRDADLFELGWMARHVHSWSVVELLRALGIDGGVTGDSDEGA